MKLKFLTILTLSIILLTSACGPTPAPTLSIEDIQGTAVADAWIALTQTQAAIPTFTSTPIPTETFTPIATLTAPPIVLPTLPPPTPVVAATPTAECNQVPPLVPQGQLINVEFKNESGGSANFSFGMNSPNKKRECVTYSFAISEGDVVAAKVLAGCYWGYAWITNPKENSTAQGTQLMCIDNPDITYHIGIGKDVIYLK